MLVNNAGHGGGGPVEEVPLGIVREAFETNVFAVIRMCQLVLPGMRAQRGGLIVNIGSAAGLVTPPTGCPYAMTKYALESLCDALRPEVAPFGIRVTLVQPGAVRTRFRAHREGARGVLGADDVAAVILKAVTAPRAKARYKAGSQARLAPVARRVLGDRGWDAFMRRLVPFPAPR